MFTHDTHPHPPSKATLENTDLLSGSDTKDQWLLALCSPGPHIAGRWAVTQSFPGGQREVPDPHLHRSSPQTLLRARCRAGAGLSPIHIFQAARCCFLDSCHQSCPAGLLSPEIHCINVCVSRQGGEETRSTHGGQPGLCPP